MSITRRLFMSKTAVAGVMAVSVPVAAAEPEMTAREKAIWHLRELERLVFEDGATLVSVMAIGTHYSASSNAKMIGIHHSRRLTCDEGMFAAKGGDA